MLNLPHAACQLALTGACPTPHQERSAVDETCSFEETTARRWERAQLFFEAKDYIEAARVLAQVVSEVPGRSRPGCCWPGPTTTPRSSNGPRTSCVRLSRATRSRSAPT
jgi:hypothetical protein